MYRYLMTFSPNRQELAAFNIREWDLTFSNAIEKKKEFPDNGVEMVAENDFIKAIYQADGSLIDLSYKSFAKCPTYANGLKSVSVLKIEEAHIETYIRLCVDEGVLMCLGCDDSLVFQELDSDEWDYIYQAWPEGDEQKYDEDENPIHKVQYLFGWVA